MMQRRIGNRITLVTELQFDGKLLVVYNPHLESRSMGRIQMSAADEILADLGAALSDGYERDYCGRHQFEILSIGFSAEDGEGGFS